ncbi:uncharacterized protein [Dermacentor albipictus]|uniref:uncharacterized protein isoform X2 n=1 Tax=Dermacentor albipictus TaxID=60249 RepID=UPI0038FCC824
MEEPECPTQQTSTCSEQPWKVDVSRLSGSQENLEQDSTPEADPQPQSCTEQQGVACVAELDNPHLKLKPDCIPEENSELEQSSQSERSQEQGTSPQQEPRSAKPEEKRDDKEEAPTCSHIVERSLKHLKEEKDHPERQRDCLDAEDISDAHLLIKRLLLDTRTVQCDSIQDRKQKRHRTWLLFDGLPRFQEAFSNWDMHRLQPSRVTLPNLPAETLKEWEALEKAVQDDGVATALREQLLRLKGSTLRKVATTVMKSIMGHSVQQRYSMYGKRGKKAFIKLQICSVVTDYQADGVVNGSSKAGSDLLWAVCNYNVSAKKLCAVSGFSSKKKIVNIHCMLTIVLLPILWTRSEVPCLGHWSISFECSLVRYCVTRCCYQCCCCCCTPLREPSIPQTALHFWTS